MLPNIFSYSFVLEVPKSSSDSIKFCLSFLESDLSFAVFCRITGIPQTCNVACSRIATLGPDHQKNILWCEADFSKVEAGRVSSSPSV